MIAATLPASSGWQWLKDAFRIFRKQPFALLALLFVINLLSQILMQIPVLGVGLFIITMPIASLIVVSACRDIQSKPAGFSHLDPKTWVASLQKPRVISRLALSGFIYAALLLLLSVVLLYPLLDEQTIAQINSIIYGVQGGAQASTDTLPDGSSLVLLLGWAVLLFVVTLMFWHVPQLIGWEDQTIGKAIFYSFVASWRNKAAFLMYFLSWFLLFALLQFIVVPLLLLLGLPALLIAFAMQVVLMIMVATIYCGFYSSYAAIFGTEKSAPN
ncbi:BPSS1780 family membrane protein [Advenella mimigardefordensis]|uniref:Putative membrane protein n=1 Tax=Advenella mimigardefordensis (strain DSM 17166 / LMG 22922 / DPN7) TaxID=1247726 RepID=W0PE47_ADVMD|nr:BPSS1780 family membrane protein [Advenella mimigardefordensis]AHG63737.1 putative membrane protein [Advenella mimigardefordensis DPN7]